MTGLVPATVGPMLQTGAPAIPPDSAEFLAGGMAALGVGLAAYGAGVAELLIPDDSGYGDADPGCWRITGGVGHAATYQTVKILPDEPSSRLVNLFAHGEGENCLPTGAYNFSTPMDVSKKTGEGSRGTSWGLQIRIT